MMARSGSASPTGYLMLRHTLHQYPEKMLRKAWHITHARFRNVRVIFPFAPNLK